MKKLLFTALCLTIHIAVHGVNIGGYAKNRNNPDNPKNGSLYFVIKYSDGSADHIVKNLAWKSGDSNVKKVEIYNSNKKPINEYKEVIDDTGELTRTELSASGMDNYYLYSVYDENTKSTKYVFTDNKKTVIKNS